MKTKRIRLLATQSNLWLLFLGIFILSGLISAVVVFSKGLSVTNMSNLVPWGLWITIDLSSIALSAGAFLLCAAVYLLNLKQFQPIARTATFIGLIGYSMAVMTLLLDIGRPDRFWHPIVFWNTHSVLWEVTMCVTLYLCVLVLETAPLVSQIEFIKRRFPKVHLVLEKAHLLAPYLAIAGLALSLLHQSSLGATYSVLKARPYWYSSGLSLLFIISAMAGGTSMTLLSSLVSSKVSKKAKIDPDLIDRLLPFIKWVLIVYLYFRFWDLLIMTYTYELGRTETLNLLTRGQFAFNFWVLEILLGIVIPILILFHPRLRKIDFFKVLALSFVVVGVIIFRWDTTLSGQFIVLTYQPHQLGAQYTSYSPAWIEIFAGSGVIAFGLLAFTIGVRYLNIVNHHSNKPVEVG